MRPGRASQVMRLKFTDESLLINVGLVTAAGLQLGEELRRVGRRARAMFGNDVGERGFDILGKHGERTPADAAKFLAELKASGLYQTDVY